MADKETRRNVMLEKSLKTLKHEAETLNAEWKRKAEAVKVGDAMLKQKEATLREAKTRMEKYLKQYDVLFRTTHQFTEAMETQWQKNVELQKENTQTEAEIRAKEEIVAKIEKDCAKIEQLVGLTKEKIGQVDQAKDKIDATKDEFKVALNELVNVTIEVERKHGEAMMKTLDDLLRQRELVNKMLVRAADTAQGTHDLTKIQENTTKNLENEINGYHQSVKQQRYRVGAA
ncbi:hypothetical protein H310_04259 [Aphanomyces invadans]|uniref:Cilia- and flagella-associated protein 58 central coiled coil domain-containing protein n=1 Tax=Aphanomyces invadans TaxID=157072 RepID=A0A024UFY2_9STRA|nr:hypothetical protein H310_04259 [Aphanomyces invadans]ETW05306.1 hypothetical protein H310_04259 [Aphanomyces invadans]|eukprot:XP_008866744.1 hypothetical protein H310_04259 [Aphanomyces invadans]